MAITTEQIYLLNHMNAVAAKVGLGDLISAAESVVASEVALASAKVLVGNGSGVAAAVTLSGDVTNDNAGVMTIGAKKVTAAKTAMTDGTIFIGGSGGAAAEQTLSGDVTVTNAGVTAVGANKVVETMLARTTSAGLYVRRVAHAVFNPSAVSGDRSIAPHTLGATIPINSFVTGIWYWVETTFTSSTDAATIALSIEAANDVVSALAISNGANIWDTTSLPVEGITKIETTSTWLATTAARAVTATVAVEALLTGKLHVFVDYLTWA